MAQWRSHGSIVLYTPERKAEFLLGNAMTPEEYAAAGSSYVAYSGRFFVDEAKKSLSHEMAVSFFPNWVGQRQARLVELNGELLQLRTDGPQRLNGVLKTVTLSWRRAQPN